MGMNLNQIENILKESTTPDGFLNALAATKEENKGLEQEKGETINGYPMHFSKLFSPMTVLVNIYASPSNYFIYIEVVLRQTIYFKIA